MELRQLKYFVAVAEELHFRRAADRLYVAQPAISEQIRKLELELGVQLFNRTNRRVEITDAGAALLEEARRLLAQADAAQRAARTASERAVARLRIGYTPYALTPSVPRALQHLAGAVPGADVSMVTGPAVRLIEQVRERRLDVVVAGLPAPTAGLRVTSLGRQRMIAAMVASDTLALAEPLSLARLTPTEIVTMARGSGPAFHDALLALCREAGITPRFVEAPEPRVESVLLAVATGAGPAVLPAAVAERYAFPGVRFVPLEDAGGFETAALTHPDDDGPATAAFLRAALHFSGRADSRVTQAARPALRLAA
jgi:DNA-binding transcriptional LysR family regulator